MRRREILIEIAMVLTVFIGIWISHIFSRPVPSPEPMRLPYVSDDRAHKFYLCGDIGQTVTLCIENLPPDGGTCSLDNLPRGGGTRFLPLHGKVKEKNKPQLAHKGR